MPPAVHAVPSIVDFPLQHAQGNGPRTPERLVQVGIGTGCLLAHRITPAPD
jgi:hypothetical protein